jgi:hypothetical protein
MHLAYAQDRYNRSRDAGRQTAGRDAELNQGVRPKPAHGKQLREGTLIPPTVGQIVLLGRRWAFVPTGKPAEIADEIVRFQPDGVRSQLVGFDVKPRPTRLGTASRSLPALNAARVARKADHQGNQDGTELQLPRIIISENLMLQRIVEAIRADASDNRWTVSGEVTEFFSANRLLIRTAQRANPN